MPHRSTIATKEEKSRQLIKAAMAVLWASPNHRLNIVQLNKALFYMDLLWLRDHGTTVTGQTYIAIHQGPVVAKYQERLVRRLETDGFAKQEADGRAKPLVATKSPESVLGRFEAQSEAERMAAFFSKTPSAKASQISHRNPGWRVAFRNKTPTPIDMEIALQQICDEDAWLDQPADENLTREFKNAIATSVDL